VVSSGVHRAVDEGKRQRSVIGDAFRAQILDDRAFAGGIIGPGLFPLLKT
jgi:hypothetical protein